MYHWGKSAGQFLAHIKVPNVNLPWAGADTAVLLQPVCPFILEVERLDKLRDVQRMDAIRTSALGNLQRIDVRIGAT